MTDERKESLEENLNVNLEEELFPDFPEEDKSVSSRETETFDVDTDLGDKYSEYKDTVETARSFAEKYNYDERGLHRRGKYKYGLDKIFSLKEAYGWAESIMSPLMMIIILLTFLFRMNQVFGVSMQPTLHEGDRLIVFPLFDMPEFGDIVVIDALNVENSGTGEMGEPIIKRVIGLPGDVIDIEEETGSVYRNGELLDEEYIYEKIFPFNNGNQDYPLTIKENEIFVLGDNRNNSIDSRIKEGYFFYPSYVDCIDMKYVLGIAALRIWPLDKIGLL